MKKMQCYFIILFFIMFSSIKAEEISQQEIPSKDMRELQKKSPESFVALDVIVKRKVDLFTGSWGRASEVSPIDNRAYLFSLSINLYNSIPPGLKPEYQELGPDEDVYEPNLWPIKKQLYFNKISTIDGNNIPPSKLTVAKQKRLLSRYKRINSPTDEELKAYFEYKYLYKHIREQVALGNILIDAQDAPASISPDELDIYNPKYYAELQDYMEKVQPLIDALIPPWEAEEQIDAITKQQPPAVVTKPQTPIVKPVQPSKPVTPETEPAPEKTDNSFWYLALGVLILLVAVGVLVRKRRP